MFSYQVAVHSWDREIIYYLLRSIFISDYAVRQEDQGVHRNQRSANEGYFGLQEQSGSNLVSLDSSGDTSLMDNYFTDTPTLNDCSFHIMCSQALAYVDESPQLPFEDL